MKSNQDIINDSMISIGSKLDKTYGDGWPKERKIFMANVEKNFIKALQAKDQENKERIKEVVEGMPIGACCEYACPQQVKLNEDYIETIKEKYNLSQ